MTDQTTPEVVEDDDEVPLVHFRLRNTDGDASTIELHTRILGTELYILVTPGEEGPLVEASHQTFDDLVGALTFILGTAMQSDEVSAETREMAVEFITACAEDDA